MTEDADPRNYSLLLAVVSLARFARRRRPPAADRPGPLGTAQRTSRALYSYCPPTQDDADKLYQQGDAEAGNKALNDVVTYAGKASDAAATTGKRLKDTEIAVRKMSEKFRDVKRTLPFEDQAPVQQAIDSLEDLLSPSCSEKGRK